MHYLPRAVRSCCCCYAALFPPYTASESSYCWMRLLSWTSVQNSSSNVEVCAWSVLLLQQNVCIFTVVVQRYLMNKVICYID